MDSRKRLKFFNEVSLGDIIDIIYLKIDPNPGVLRDLFLKKECNLEGQVYSLSPRGVRLLKKEEKDDVFMDRCLLKTKRISLKRMKGYKVENKYFEDIK